MKGREGGGVIKEGEPRKYNDGEERKSFLAMTSKDTEKLQHATRASMIL